MKELDAGALTLAREFSKRQEKHRSVYYFIVWLDGDPTRMKQWGERHRHGMSGVTLAVIPADNATLENWRLHPDADNTTVVLDRVKPLANFVNLRRSGLPKLEGLLREHFAKYRR